MEQKKTAQHTKRATTESESDGLSEIWIYHLIYIYRVQTYAFNRNNKQPYVNSRIDEVAIEREGTR